MMRVSSTGGAVYRVDATPPKIITSLQASGPVASSRDGQVIEGLDVTSTAGDGITVTHKNVTVRHCRITHTGGAGIRAHFANAPVFIQDCLIDHAGAGASGAGPSDDRNNIDLEQMPGTIIERVHCKRGSANIYVNISPGTIVRNAQLEDARNSATGSRGQNVQFDHSSYCLLEDFSCVNGPTSWTEDNINLFGSDACIVRRGLVSYNNSPSGDGVMHEGCRYCLCEDVDFVSQGNGAMAAVAAGGGVVFSVNVVFRRCRTRDTYNDVRDGRAAPDSAGLSIFFGPSGGHQIDDCTWWNLARPTGKLFDAQYAALIDFNQNDFTPRAALNLSWPWGS